LGSGNVSSNVATNVSAGLNIGITNLAPVLAAGNSSSADMDFDGNDPPLSMRISSFEYALNKSIGNALSFLKPVDAFVAQQDGVVHNSIKTIFSTFNPGITVINLFTSYNYETDMFTDKMSMKHAAFGIVVSAAAPLGIGVKVAKGGAQLLGSAPAKLTQQGLQHIVARHWATSGAKGAGKFLEGTTARGLKEMIKTTTTQGVFRANTFGRAGTIAEYNFGRVIGKTSAGAPASSLRVVIGPNGNVITAFPH
jgi:hypothetical protein